MDKQKTIEINAIDVLRVLGRGTTHAEHHNQPTPQDIVNDLEGGMGAYFNDKEEEKGFYKNVDRVELILQTLERVGLACVDRDNRYEISQGGSDWISKNVSLFISRDKELKEGV